MMRSTRRSSLLLALLASAALLAPSAAASPESASRAPKAPGPPPTRLFNIVMVQAEIEGTSAYTGLPEAARKAIQDLKDFLPYRAYKLTDSALIRTARGGSTKLKGPDGGEYDVQMSFRQDEDGDSEIFVDRFQVRQFPSPVPLPGEKGATKGGKSPAMEYTGNQVHAKVLIETSFGMHAGETLVVGSSRLDGGKTALILLVTAVN